MSTGESEPEVSAAVAEEADRGEGQALSVSREKEAQLKARSFIGVGAVDCVVLDIAGPLLADSSLFGAGRIRRAHQFAQIGDRFSFSSAIATIGPLDMKVVRE